VTIDRVIGLAGSCVVLMALLGSAAVLLASRRLDVALAVLLDLLTAAGLLHLAASPTFRSAAFAGIVLAVRHVVGWGLRRGRGTDPQDGIPPQVAWRLWQIARAGLRRPG
jgi:hypothetical protein